MKVRMEKTAAGPRGTWISGTEQSLPRDVAQELIAAGAAVPVGAQRETAVDEPAEQATEPRTEVAVDDGREDRSGLLLAFNEVEPYVEDLSALGITSVGDLANASVKDMTIIKGVGPATAEKLIEVARAALEEE